MSHPQYEGIGEPDDKVIEECGELIQAISKARRFGWGNYHPEDTPDHTNAVHVCEEMEDVLIRCRELRAKLLDMRLIGSLAAPYRSTKEEPRVVVLETGESITIRCEFGSVFVERARKACEYDTLVVTQNTGGEIVPSSAVMDGDYLVMITKRTEAGNGKAEDSVAGASAGDAGGVPPISEGSRPTGA